MKDVESQSNLDYLRCALSFHDEVVRRLIVMIYDGWL
jgi:hypothetical protein